MNTKNNYVKIVRGNAFSLRVKVRAYRINGEEIENFVISESDTLKLTHLNTETVIPFTIENNVNALIDFDGTLATGFYGLDFSGTYEGEEWRWNNKIVFQIVESTSQGNIPNNGILCEDTHDIYGGVIFSTIAEQQWAQEFYEAQQQRAELFAADQQERAEEFAEDQEERAEQFETAEAAREAAVQQAIASIEQTRVVNQTESVVTINPNILNLWTSPVSTLTISFASGAAGIVNEYRLQFTTGSEVGDITFPDGIAWAPDTPYFEANYTYQISVINNLGIVAGWEAASNE